MATNIDAIKRLLTQRCPRLSDESKQYCEGVLETCSDDFASGDDIYDSIGPILAELLSDNDSQHVRQLCTDIYQLVKISDDEPTTDPDNDIVEPLESAHALSTSADDGRRVENTSSIWLKKAGDLRKMKVDANKLSKAEAKLRQKQETRQTLQSSDKSASAASAYTYDKVLSASEAISRRDQAIHLKSRDVRIENFDIAYQDEKLLVGANLHLVFGRLYGLVGRNGCGKSTLLRLLAARELSVPTHISLLFVEQEVVGDGTSILESVLASDEKRASLFREADELRDRGGDSSRLVKVYEELTAMDAYSAPARAAQILAGLGFSGDHSRATRELSGGWRMRLALARALFARPDLLILDEPTNYLDMRTVIWLQDYLAQWPSTLLLVSHDRRFLNEVATDMLHLSGRQLRTYRGNYDQFLTQRDEHRRQQQRDYDAQQLFIAQTQAFIDNYYRLIFKFRHDDTRASSVQSKIRMLERLERVEPPASDEPPIRFDIPPVEPMSTVAFRLDDCSFRYSPDSPNVFDKANVSAGADARVVVVGANGAGKSTMVKLLLDELQPTGGFVFRDRRLHVQYFAQHHVDALDGDLHLSAMQCLARRFPGERDRDYHSALTRFALAFDKHAQPMTTLSGGEKTRVALALMMSFGGANFLIFDEVSSHMDTESVEALGAALRRFQGGVLLVSHDEFLVELVCNELWLCADGKVEIVKGGYAAYRRRVKRELADIQAANGGGGVKPASSSN